MGFSTLTTLNKHKNEYGQNLPKVHLRSSDHSLCTTLTTLFVRHTWYQLTWANTKQ
jgi:hypothetical protein